MKAVKAVKAMTKPVKAMRATKAVDAVKAMRAMKAAKGARGMRLPPGFAAGPPEEKADALAKMGIDTWLEDVRGVEKPKDVDKAEKDM